MFLIFLVRFLEVLYLYIHFYCRFITIKDFTIIVI